MANKFGKTKFGRSFITNKYKKIFQDYISKTLSKNGVFDSKRFGEYIDAVIKMEKNILINERNRGKINLMEEKPC